MVPTVIAMDDSEGSEALSREVTLDEFGRIVIPKPLREAVGIQAGTDLQLSVSETDTGDLQILLQPRREAPVIIQKDGHSVHTGRLEEDVDVGSLLRRQRSVRALHIAGLS